MPARERLRVEYIREVKPGSILRWTSSIAPTAPASRGGSSSFSTTSPHRRAPLLEHDRVRRGWGSLMATRAHHPRKFVAKH